MNNLLQQRQTQLALLSGQLNQLSPLATLARGYAVVRKDAHVVRSIQQVAPGDGIKVVFCDGVASCTVTDCSSDQKESEI